MSSRAFTAAAPLALPETQTYNWLHHRGLQSSFSRAKRTGVGGSRGISTAPSTYHKSEDCHPERIPRSGRSRGICTAFAFSDGRRSSSFIFDPLIPAMEGHVTPLRGCREVNSDAGLGRPEEYDNSLRRKTRCRSLGSPFPPARRGIGTRSG